MADNITITRIPQLAEILENTGSLYLAAYNQDDDKTYKILSSLLAGATDTTLQWDSGENYSTGDIIEWNLKLWKSKIDNNLGNVPAENDNWTEVSKATGGTGINYWNAGVYSVNPTIVIQESNLYLLDSSQVSMPFESTDFGAEKTAGIWIQLTGNDIWEPEKITAATTEHPRWNDSGDPNIYGTDKFGFGVLPAGDRHNTGYYELIGGNALFWTKTEDLSTTAIQLLLQYDLSDVTLVAAPKGQGKSVRLVRPYAPADGGKIDGRILSGTFSDYDGNTYDGVIIGDQVWSTTNLKTTSYADGTPIPTGYNDTDWSNLTTGAYAVYDHNLVSGIDSEAEMIAAYGLLYNWYAVDNALGLATNGTVPTDAEFTQLTDYIIATYPEIDSTNIGDALKSVRQVNSPFEAESDKYIKPKTDELTGEQRLTKEKYIEGTAPNNVSNAGKLVKQNAAGDGKDYTSFDYTQIVQVADIDMTDIAVGESKILLVQKQSDGSAAFEGAVAQVDKIAPPGLAALLGPDQGWNGDEITLSGDNSIFALGQNAQEFYNDEDWFLCISHTETSATWKRNRGQDCLNIGETTADAIIAELETETGWNGADFKQITTKSKKGSWFRRNTGYYAYLCIDTNNGWCRIGTGEAYALNPSITNDANIITELENESGWSEANFKQVTNTSKIGYWYGNSTGGYLYKCIDTNNGWIRVGVPDNITLEISSASHPTLTANLEAHDFATNGWYDETSDGTNEPALQGQKYVNYTTENIYERLQNNMWAKIL